jgi:hypothetical protein|mmetsp:Transcript_24085/g.32294  ORF Transcript_24085/g.32294 Transcript_24085/m.32294 type:complete len:87 (-) Transcript_24085:728-988(-)
MVVNSCKTAVEEDNKMRELGLTDVTYSDVECADDDVFNFWAEKVSIWSKLMTQDPSNPAQLAKYGGREKTTYFTNRSQTGLLLNMI